MDAVLSYIGHILVVILCWAIALSLVVSALGFIIDFFLRVFTGRSIDDRVAEQEAKRRNEELTKMWKDFLNALQNNPKSSSNP